MWRWMFVAVGWAWYLWRLYTLTVNWATFPDMQRARAIWQKRAQHSFWIGAAVLNATLYTAGLIRHPLAVAIGFAACFAAVLITQPFFITAVLVLTMRYRAWKSFWGKDPQNSFFGELAAWHYLSPEDKQAYKQLLKRGGAFDHDANRGLAREIREQKQATTAQAQQR